jgi:hypothetical protein
MRERDVQPYGVGFGLLRLAFALRLKFYALRLAVFTGGFLQFFSLLPFL